MTKHELIEELTKLSRKINDEYNYEIDKYGDLLDDIVNNIKYGDPKITVKSDKEY